MMDLTGIPYYLEDADRVFIGLSRDKISSIVTNDELKEKVTDVITHCDKEEK